MVATHTNLNIPALESEYSQKSPREILQFALERFDNIAISFSGAEDVVLIDMASKLTKNFRVYPRYRTFALPNLRVFGSSEKTLWN